MLCDQFAGMRMSVVGHVHQVASSSIDETTVVRTEYPESPRVAEKQVRRSAMASGQMYTRAAFGGC